jgi:hypothetical protein
MPKSSPAGKLWSRTLLADVHARRPLRRILDIGAGMGTYTSYRVPGQTWIGVEVWTPYIAQFGLIQKYDQLLNNDARTLDWSALAPLDLVICGDVLEHMTKDEAIALLNQALSCARLALVSIPIVHSPQEAMHGNPFEEHVKPDWSHDECMESLPNVVLAHVDMPIGVYILSRDPDDAAFLVEWARAQNAENRADAAKQFLQQYRVAVLAKPHDVGLLREYAYRCGSISMNHVVETMETVSNLPNQPLPARMHQLELLVYCKERLLRRQRGLPPGNALGWDDLQFNFARAEAMRWAQAARDWCALKPTSQPGWLQLAAATLATGGPDAAEPHFARLREMGVQTNITAAHFSASFHAPLVEAAADALTTIMPAVQWLKAPPADLDRVIFVAADHGYFESYGLALLSSFRKHAGDCRLVLHIFDAEATQLEMLSQQLAGEACVAALSAESTSRVKAAMPDPPRVYYHAARFLRFMQLMDRLPSASGWCLDADLLFNGPAEELFETLAGFDVALWLAPARAEAHNKIGAGLVGIAPTASGRAYLRRVAGYIAVFLREGKLLWGIDQIALYAVLARLVGDGQAPAISPVPQSLYDGSFGDHTVLWPGKCDSADPAFAKFSAARAAA